MIEQEISAIVSFANIRTRRATLKDDIIIRLCYEATNVEPNFIMETLSFKLVAL